MNLDPANYPHTIKPFEHQKKHLETKYSKKSWGLLWEQGTAKTKPVIDTACVLYSEGKINGLVVVAPSGVERNWNSDELPKHLNPDVSLDTFVFVFKNAKKHTADHKRAAEYVLRHDGLSVLLMSYDAVMTKEGKLLINKFLQTRRAMYVLDEAHNIKSPSAKRTTTIKATGKKAAYRRILTGTPISVGPFDLYSQILFLDEWFWKNKGIHGSIEYRQFFGRWLTRDEVKRTQGYDPGYDKLIEYQNLDKLTQWLSEISDRVLKDDVLDLPPKLYSKRYFSLGRDQRMAYDQLKKEMMINVGDEILTAELPIVLLLRLQQIACNYIPTGEEQPIHTFEGSNPRLNVMEDLRDSIFTPSIIWARFHHDIDMLMDLMGKDAVRYDGTVDDDEAEKNKLAFQHGDKKWFVGTAQKGGPGLTLTRAKNVIYYSNSFRLIDRLQSEDRAHRAGMDNNPVNVIDIVAENTVDERIIDNLRGKKEISAEIQGDRWRDWI